VAPEHGNAVGDDHGNTEKEKTREEKTGEGEGGGGGHRSLEILRMFVDSYYYYYLLLVRVKPVDAHSTIIMDRSSGH
jgi:hypothetical protein